MLAELAELSSETWPAQLRARFAADPALIEQALLWLHANRARSVDRETPSLGAGGDRYELGVMLDAGATAAVWQAYDRKLARDVAIKLFRIEQSPALDQILIEARAASEVISDHVVRVLDVHDGEPPYLVMELVGEHDPGGGELVPGASAATCRPRDLDEAVRWIRDVARGVHDAHLRNVFHRDLKPHNVLVMPCSRRTKIADFGLAVSGATDGPGLLRRGPAGLARIAGTPDYIAPEQARGLRPNLDLADVDDRTTLVALDVWGLGALAYDLLAGQAPWRATGELEPWEVAATATEPPDLERTAQGARVPARLRRVIAKTLALDPGARYASAGQVADELDAILARRPTSLERSRPVRFVLWCRRNPQLALTALLAMVLATMALIASSIARDVREQRNELAREMTAARVANAELAQRMQDARRELADTEATLQRQAETLRNLERTLAEATREYDAIVSAKAQALRDADAATRQLAEQLATVRRERDTAQVAHKMYEAFWNRGRGEAERAAQERDEAEHDRNAARDERDHAVRERDAALAALAQAQQERDAARADRDRAEAIRRRVETDLATLAADMAALLQRGIGVRDAGVPAATTPATTTPPSSAVTPAPTATAEPDR